jgi:hypothetical protein
MLVHVTWQETDTSEAAARRSLEVFGKWQPPAGFEFKGFWQYADSSGGAAIVEADSAATIAKAIAPFAAWMRFDVKPVIPMEEAVPILADAIAFRDSVG